MKQYLLDTNYILRLITNDNPQQYKIVRNIFDQTKADEFKLIIHPITVAECVYVLTSPSLYNLSHQTTCKALSVVFNQKNVILEEAQTVNTALNFYENNKLDFADCFLLAKYKINNLDDIKTFDQKILKLKNHIIANL